VPSLDAKKYSKLARLYVNKQIADIPGLYSELLEGYSSEQESDVHSKPGSLLMLLPPPGYAELAGKGF
jgi:hypothetical protein